MNLVAAVCFFTCYVVAVASGYATCGIGIWADTTCVDLYKCQQYSKPMEQFHRADASLHESFMINRVRPAMCGFTRRTPMVCCPNNIKPTNPQLHSNGKKDSCGAIIWHKSLSPDGTPAELEEFPWLALLQYETKNGKTFGCGGVLISDRHVLTAAHCLGLSGNELIGVRLGEHDLRKAQDCVSDPQLPYCNKALVDVGIEKQIPHENYDFLRGPSDFDPLTYDIALLKLDRSVTTDVIKPICLPDAPTTNPQSLFRVDVAGKYMSAGWGSTLNNIYPQSLVKLMSRLKQVDKNLCNKMYGLTLNDDIICALSKSSSTCIADSGGPLMGFNRKSRMIVSGIYSPIGEQPCREDGVPSTFVDVSKYVDWIRLKMHY